MEVTLARINDAVNFRAINEDQLEVRIDGGPDDGGVGGGVRPMQMVLMALGGCSSIDVVLILKKMRQDLKDMRVLVTGTRAEDQVPRVFTDIHLTFFLTGTIEQAKAEKAISLSINKYCSVAQMLVPKVNITYDLELESA